MGAGKLIHTEEVAYGFSIGTKLVTLDDIEWRYGCYCASCRVTIL